MYEDIEAIDGAAAVPTRRVADIGDTPPTVRMRPVEIEADRLAAERPCECRSAGVIARITGDLVHRASDHLLGGQPEPLLVGIVGKSERQRCIHEPDEDRHTVGDEAQLADGSHACGGVCNVVDDPDDRTVIIAHRRVDRLPPPFLEPACRMGDVVFLNRHPVRLLGRNRPLDRCAQVGDPRRLGIVRVVWHRLEQATADQAIPCSQRRREISVVDAGNREARCVDGDDQHRRERRREQCVSIDTG